MRITANCDRPVYFLNLRYSSETGLAADITFNLSLARAIFSPPPCTREVEAIRCRTVSTFPFSQRRNLKRGAQAALLAVRGTCPGRDVKGCPLRERWTVPNDKRRSSSWCLRSAKPSAGYNGAVPRLQRPCPDWPKPWWRSYFLQDPSIIVMNPLEWTKSGAAR